MEYCKTMKPLDHCDLLKFSALRAIFDPEKALNPSISKGYLEVAINFLNVQLAVEPFSKQLVQGVVNQYTKYIRRTSCLTKNIKETSSISYLPALYTKVARARALYSLARLVPSFRLVLSIDMSRDVYKSPWLSFKENLITDLKNICLRKICFFGKNRKKRKMSTFRQTSVSLTCRAVSPSRVYSSHRSHSQKLKKGQIRSIQNCFLYERSFSCPKTRNLRFVSCSSANDWTMEDESTDWIATFDVHNPYSKLFFHIQATADTDIWDVKTPYILASYSIPVNPTLLSLNSESKYELSFMFPIPFSSLSSDHEHSIHLENNSRRELASYRCVKISFRLTSQYKYASWFWKQVPVYGFPAFSISELQHYQRRPLECLGVRLTLGDRVIIQRPIKNFFTLMIRLRATNEILKFWKIQLCSFMGFLRSWTNPFCSALCLILILLLAIPRFTCGLFLLYISFFLFFAAYTRPWLNQDPLKNELVILTSKTRKCRKACGEVHQLSQDFFYESPVNQLVDSALPEELRSVAIFINSWLNCVLFFLIPAHLYLTGYSTKEINHFYHLSSQNFMDYFDDYTTSSVGKASFHPYVEQQSQSFPPFKLKSPPHASDSYVSHAFFSIMYLSFAFCLSIASCIILVAPNLFLSAITLFICLTLGVWCFIEYSCTRWLLCLCYQHMSRLIHNITQLMYSSCLIHFRKSFSTH